jgi:membrane protease YdiL (CAAX protease family)
MPGDASQLPEPLEAPVTAAGGSSAGDRVAANLRGFGPLGIVALVVIVEVIGLILGIGFKFLMKAIVMPLLGADSVNQTYHYLVGNSYASLAVVPMMIVTGGFGEETFFRGYLFERFGKLIGHGPGARALTVLITSVVFASLHYFDQGLAGVQQATITGLVFGTVFAFTRRLWPLMCAHASFDLTAVAIIYAGLESSVAHVVFK